MGTVALPGPAGPGLSDGRTHWKGLLPNPSFSFGHCVYAGQVTSHLKGTLVLFDSLDSSEKERNQKAEQGSLQTDKMGTKCQRIASA